MSFWQWLFGLFLQGGLLRECVQKVRAGIYIFQGHHKYIHNISGYAHTSESSYLKSFLDLLSEETISMREMIEFNPPKASSDHWQPRPMWSSISETETLSIWFIQESNKTPLKQKQSFSRTGYHCDRFLHRTNFAKGIGIL